MEKVTKTVARHNLISRGDSILIALSGGPDSVALLRVLITLRRRLKLTLAAVYINHQIRPRAAKKEENFCQQLCDRFQIDLTIVSENIPVLAESARDSIEEAARDFRYTVFEQLADEDGHDRIALGHHADDRAETVLFRLVRGTGPSGMVGIPVKRDKIIRPLFDLTKQEILGYLKRLRQDFCEDRSNRGTEFSRNMIRNKLLPLIREHLNPRVDAALVGLSDIVMEEDQFIESFVTNAVDRVVTVSPGGKLTLDLPQLSRYDEWLRKRLLRRCLKALSERLLPPGREVMDRLMRFSGGSGSGMSLPGGTHAVLLRGQLVLFRQGRLTYRVPVQPGKVVPLVCLGMQFRSRVQARGSDAIRKKRRSRAVAVDWAKLVPPLQLRNIRPGDRFRPLGLRGSKKVGDFLTDRKVPKVFRDEIPLLCDRKGVVWLAGYEISDRVKIDVNTKEVFTVGYQVRNKRTADTV